MIELTASAWYALVCRPRHEKAVAASLQMKRLESFVPLYRDLRKWSDRTKQVDLPLFPGYAFCRFGIQERGQVLKTPGVTSVVGNGRMPLPIDDEEIVRLQRVVASGLSLQPWAFLEAGDKARVECGPLRGVEGIVVRAKNRDRMVVSITLLKRAVAVEVDREWLAALSGRALAQGGFPVC
jgi:transcription antitermination factor NusG